MSYKFYEKYPTLYSIEVEKIVNKEDSPLVQACLRDSTLIPLLSPLLVKKLVTSDLPFAFRLALSSFDKGIVECKDISSTFTPTTEENLLLSLDEVLVEIVNYCMEDSLNFRSTCKSLYSKMNDCDFIKLCCISSKVYYHKYLTSFSYYYKLYQLNHPCGNCWYYHEWQTCLKYVCMIDSTERLRQMVQGLPSYRQKLSFEKSIVLSSYFKAKNMYNKMASDKSLDILNKKGISFESILIDAMRYKLFDVIEDILTYTLTKNEYCDRVNDIDTLYKRCRSKIVGELKCVEDKDFEEEVREFLTFIDAKRTAISSTETLMNCMKNEGLSNILDNTLLKKVLDDIIKSKYKRKKEIISIEPTFIEFSID